MNDAKQMVSEKDALESLRSGINGVVGRRWMVCVWRVDKGTVDLAHRMTWNFPVGDFDTCLEQLKKALDEEKKATEPAAPPPLEIAEFLSPVEGGEDVMSLKEAAEIDKKAVKEDEAGDSTLDHEGPPIVGDLKEQFEKKMDEVRAHQIECSRRGVFSGCIEEKQPDRRESGENQ